MTDSTARLMAIVWLASLGGTVFFGVRENFMMMGVSAAAGLGVCVGGMLVAFRKW